MVCGMALGVWCALYCEYPVGTKYRVGSFPIPVVIFHMEEGNWVDFPLDTFFAWGVIAANVTTVTALATLPFWVASITTKHDEHELPA
jgi:hypothetical protein